MNRKETKISKDIKINKKSARKNYSNQAGITLIALVVTIVVLLILAGVSLNAIFSDSGIIQKAKDAQTKADEATQKDLEEIDSLDQLVNKYANGGKTELKAYDKAEKNADGTLKENAKYTDSEDTTVTIPNGFKVSDVASDGNSDGEQTVSTGLVIQDKDKNEFVWVPVNYTATGTLDDDGLDSGFKDTFKRSTTISSNTEPYGSGYDGEKEDYIKMMKSVQENKGFYIGRYEAGTTEPRTSSTTGKSKVVVKRDAYPYIYVKWGDKTNTVGEEGAVYLSKNMYSANEIGATSTLCYGVQWDAIMKFVEDSTHSITNSTTWGNYKDNAWTIERTTAQYTDTTNVKTGNWTAITSDKSKTSSASYLLTTGASDTFKVKNIFDLAGNVSEWTMEASSGAYRVIRGGCYDLYGSDYPASDRCNDNPDTSYNVLGFRLALYL